jgi:tRNA modification GTPase
MVVAIAGRPNVGKSTLLNRLAQADVAIVSEIAGTTRDILREHLVLDGMALTVVDTAGLRETQDPLEAEGIRRAWQAFERAELALFVADDGAGLTQADRALLDKLPATLKVLLVFNKCDLVGQAPGAFQLEGGEALRVCALTGEGLDALRSAIRGIAGLDERVEGVFTARARHLDALRTTQRHFQAARACLRGGCAAELAAEELRLAHGALGEISGRVSSDDLLGAIFSRFCIGK